MVELAELFVRRGFASVAVVAVESPPGAPSMEPVISRLSSSHPASSISFHLLPRVAYTPPPRAATLRPDVRRAPPQQPRAPLPPPLLSPPPAPSSSTSSAPTPSTSPPSSPSPPTSSYPPAPPTSPCSSSSPTTPPAPPASRTSAEPRPLPGREAHPRLRHAPGAVGPRHRHLPALVRNFGRLPNSRASSSTRSRRSSPAARALRDGLPLPGCPMPPTYCVGPLVTGGEGDGRPEAERHACLSWLDSRPERSVVFLCFGSLGAFSADQLRETALGLEWSGHGFLWVRTAGRGLVVPSWAPQVEVLRHAAVGAFVSHCGWNSSLEAITAGVPLVCWPLYAEQRMNKVFLVEEIRVGVAVDGYDQVLVAAEEVERKVRLVMETEDGERLRARAAELKDKAAAALDERGSSHAAFQEFWKDLEKQEENGA
uniref:Glycosyltransferase n=1 Tax=Ananas comosus var. bracteatus TaxID=296719 RepID=A0A6V7PTG9_ANACO|nr:unnamed protein product [Ananas comosus var. bracteatus]